MSFLRNDLSLFVKDCQMQLRCLSDIHGVI